MDAEAPQQHDATRCPQHTLSMLSSACNCCAWLRQVMLTLGMLTAGVVDWALTSAVGPQAWRWMVGLPAAPGEGSLQQQRQQGGMRVRKQHLLLAHLLLLPPLLLLWLWLRLCRRGAAAVAAGASRVASLAGDAWAA